ncbi:MAG: EpsG family protein [Flavobacteriaceae bacterium]|nr:EpsG family protein [Flavobacteriaceae bacterium]
MNKQVSKLGLPLFFVLPWAGFLAALLDLKSKTSAFVYIAFSMLFGYSISFSDTSADSYRYAEAFKRFDNTLGYSAISYQYQSGEARDPYRMFLFYFTSQFSNNPKVMYLFAGLVYGIFSYLCLRIFVKEQYGGKWDICVVVLTSVFFTFVSVANINGFRFWTGAVVLFYATYNYIILKKTAWIIGILITPLFHYGFILIMPVLILYKFIHPILYNYDGVKPILFYIFISTFIISWVLDTNVINLSFLTESSVLSGEIGDRIDYVNSDRITTLVESRKETSLFLSVQKYFNYAIKIYIFIVILFLNQLIKRIKGDKTKYANLFAFILFFYSVAFIATSFPSGGRFLNIAHLFLFVFLAKLYAVYKEIHFQRLILWALPAFSFAIAFTNFLLPFLVLTPTFWYGNVFWLALEGLDFHLF